MGYVFMRPHFRKNMKKQNEDTKLTGHKVIVPESWEPIVPEDQLTIKDFMVTQQAQNPALSMANRDFVTVEDLNGYSQVIKKELETLKDKIKNPVSNENAPAMDSRAPFRRRLWNLIKNPFTYLFHGRIEW